MSAAARHRSLDSAAPTPIVVAEACAQREARRVARAQRLAEGPSTAALALRKAQRWQEEIQQQGLRRADIAQAEGITRARVTQVMGLLELPADLQTDLTDNKPYTRSWSVRHALEMAGA